MSPLVLLGSLGTAVSTISMVPHLMHAVRTRKPAGSAFAWCFGAFSSGIWFVYGFAVGDVLVAAPGFVTIPVGLGLGLWCRAHDRRARPRRGADVPMRDTSVVLVPAWDQSMLVSAGDTLEMPRIVA